MSVFHTNILAGASGAGGAGGAAAGFQIDRSLRFNDDDSAYLSRTPSSTGDRRTFTWSGWVKRSSQGTEQVIFSVSDTPGSLGPRGQLRFLSDKLNVALNPTGSSWIISNTAAVFRDSSAWYHVVLVVDTTQATSTDRVNIYVNGVAQTLTGSFPTLDQDLSFNVSGSVHTIGKWAYSSSGYFDGYLAEVYFIDGQALAPTDFGESDADTGVWNPIQYSGSSYGTNGFHLDFSDNTSTTTITEDSSGNNNDWTANNISVTAGADNDSLIDTPTNYSAASGNNGGNYCVLNPLDQSPSTGILSNGNLNYEYANTALYAGVRGTIGVSSGKWYYECKLNSMNSGFNTMIGVATQGFTYLAASNIAILGNETRYYLDDGRKQVSTGTRTATTYGASYTTGDVIGVALDLDAGTITFYKNGTSQGQAFSGLSGTYHPAVVTLAGGNLTVNFGQRPFEYTPPANHLSLCTQNLDDSTIADGSTAMAATLHTGNGSTQTITGLNFASAPDLVWIKNRTNGNRNVLTDSVRGVTKEISTDQTTAETTRTNGLTAFNSDGFTLGSYEFYNNNGNSFVSWAWDGGSNSSKTFTVKVVSDSGNKYRFDDFGTSAVTLDLEEGSTYVFDQSDSSNSGHPLRFSTTSNGTHGGGSEYTTGVTTTGTPGSSGAKTTIVVAASAPTLYYYCSAHSGMGGQANTNSTAGASNFDGAHQSTVQANSSTGFSISTHSRTTAASISTWGHGLNAAPEFLILAPFNNAHPRFAWHKSIGNKKRIYLNSTGAGNSYSFDVWSSDSTTLGVYGTIIAGGGTALDCVTYAWAPIEGYSRFGSYEGNGSSSAGPFIFTGFRPRLIMTKDIDTASNWNVWDTSRSPYNLADERLRWSGAAAEDNGADIDILSNGFKIRDSNSDVNENNRTFIYCAWAENPFKTARAR